VAVDHIHRTPVDKVCRRLDGVVFAKICLEGDHVC
jgi:hypothetical protein